jgi:hypothetical protein
VTKPRGVEEREGASKFNVGGATGRGNGMGRMVNEWSIGWNMVMGTPILVVCLCATTGEFVGMAWW